ncbi:MAG: NAD(P)/FAD-dependent oxidoreductase [Hyphomicrobiaceae bacterium]
MSDPPARSVNVVIVGAGVIGCSIAWALSQRGVSDILVLDKSAITNGSTWHAAGLVGQYRRQQDLARLMQISAQVYNDLEAETPIDWKASGSLRLAASVGRWRELQESTSIARRYGIEFHLLSGSEAQSLFPLMEIDDLHGAAFIPGDGYIDPNSLTLEYANRARSGGVIFVENCLVQSIDRQGDRLTTALTNLGPITARKFVLAPGVWARRLARSFGVTIPVSAVEHQYVVTEKDPRIPATLPALRDPDSDFYVKPEVGALAVGGWEADARLASQGDVPLGFARELYNGDLDRLTPLLQAAAKRIPVFGDLGIRQIINGPIPVSADGEPILGALSGLDNAYVAAGFTSGIAASAGAGQILADWIVNGEPTFALPSLYPSRFDQLPPDDVALDHRALVAYSSYYVLSEEYIVSNSSEVTSSTKLQD